MRKNMNYDKIIIGAGIYGLYSALICAKQQEKILVLEYDEKPFMRATYINQARVHMGYHYPRSLSTAKKSANYFQRFHEEYKFCIHKEFKQIYATSSDFSYTNAIQFKKFCEAANIFCEEVSTEKYFQPNLCDGAFLTEEYTYDAQILKKYFLEELENYQNVEIIYQARICKIEKKETHFELIIENKPEKIHTDFILNATYASVNQILKLLSFEPFQIKYELCEIILCMVDEELKDIGLTVMDGPFFSIMPFGLTGLHSLTSVTFTPHKTSFQEVPTFDCQKQSHGYCSEKQLGNCNQCIAKPESAWGYMSHLAKKYIHEKYQLEYKESLYSMKPILKASELDDSRPTVIKTFSENPTFISVLSGKINTVYDMEEVLNKR